MTSNEKGETVYYKTAGLLGQYTLLAGVYFLYYKFSNVNLRMADRNILPYTTKAQNGNKHIDCILLVLEHITIHDLLNFLENLCSLLLN